MTDAKSMANKATISQLVRSPLKLKTDAWQPKEPKEAERLDQEVAEGLENGLSLTDQENDARLRLKSGADDDEDHDRWWSYTACS